MSSTNILEVIEVGELILQVDDERTPGEPFHLPVTYRTMAEERLAAAKSANAATSSTDGNRVAAAERVKDAVTELRDALRAGYKAVLGVPKETLPEADRLGALTAFGWQGGRVGNLNPAIRVEALANLAVSANATVPAAARYPAAVQARIVTALALLNANQPASKTGARAAAITARNAARDLLALGNGRVRFWYCSASDAQDKTPELARINFQPRREPGEAQPQAKPDAPGAVAFDAAALTLSVAALPAHATFLRAWRQPAGGAAELAGVSTGATVSVVQFSPLTADVAYEFWLTGGNSRGNGPQSGHVAHQS